MPEAGFVLARVSTQRFDVKVRVHQGSVLSPLLFIIVLEALSREFRAGVPWEHLYADDLIIIADSLEECVRRLLIWKGGSWYGKEALDMERSHGEDGVEGKCRKDKSWSVVQAWTSCRVQANTHAMSCRTVGNNSIYCNGCKLWVHKKCSGLQRLIPNPDYRCAWEMPVSLMADHRVKLRADLMSWRW